MNKIPICALRSGWGFLCLVKKENENGCALQNNWQAHKKPAYQVRNSCKAEFLEG